MNETAIERVAEAAHRAGLTWELSSRTRRVDVTAPDGAWMYVVFDTAGRLTGATTVRGDQPAAGLETRIMAWVDEHTAAQPSTSDAVFGELDRQYAAEDSFAADPQRRGSIGPRTVISTKQHPFEPSWTGRTCARMVVRDGFGVDCGQGPDAPVHDDPDAGATVIPLPRTEGHFPGVTLDRNGTGYQVGVWSTEENAHVHGITLSPVEAADLYRKLGQHFGARQ
jgi:hypothetical protein